MDDFAAAKALVWGVLLSLPFWLLAGVAAWLLWRRH